MAATRSRRPRCECCDEVLEELFAMRQNFETSFHRFNNQIVELRRELRAFINDETASTSSSQRTVTWAGKRKAFTPRADNRRSNAGGDSESDASQNSNNRDRRKKCTVHQGKVRHTQQGTSRGASSPYSSSTPKHIRDAVKKKLMAELSRCQEKIPGSGEEHGEASPSIGCKKSQQQQQRAAKEMKPSWYTHASVKNEMPTPTEGQAGSTSRPIAERQRPLVEFFGIQLRVLPTCPFNSNTEFEQWECLLTSDEDQRDHLRVELMQGHFADAEKYVKHIWSSVLGEHAAQSYSYRGNAKTGKKPVKKMTFTLIFKECFLRRFEHCDVHFFMTRTMRFFNYAHDRQRRMSRTVQSNFESVQVVGEATTTMDSNEEQFLDDDSSTSALQEITDEDGAFLASA